MRNALIVSLLAASFSGFAQVIERADSMLMRLDLVSARELKWSQTLKAGQGGTPNEQGAMAMNMTMVATVSAARDGKSAIAIKTNMEGMPPSGNSQGIELNTRGALLKGAGQTFEFAFPTLPDLAVKKGDTWKATYPAMLPQGQKSFTANYTFDGMSGEGAAKVAQVSAVYTSDGWLTGTVKYTFNVNDGFMQTMDQSIVQNINGQKGFTIMSAKRIP